MKPLFCQSYLALIAPTSAGSTELADDLKKKTSTRSIQFERKVCVIPTTTITITTTAINYCYSPVRLSACMSIRRFIEEKAV